MAKVKTFFVCQNCGSKYSKWSGRCEQCGEWNTLVEEVITDAKTAIAQSERSARVLSPQKIATVNDKSPAKSRLSSGIKELDIVLGGGILSDSVILLAGQPGIGKSTILIQIAGMTAKTKKVLYVSGEESLFQVAARAKRLGVSSASQLDFLSSINAADIAKTINEINYDLVIIDSIQTMQLDSITSAAGSVSQITNTTNLLVQIAKKTNTAMIIVGHITKEGNIAGPKVLEHIVDVVLQFEGDKYGHFKTIRALKNRFGSTEELAIFEMNKLGLQVVDNPSAILLQERSDSDGSVVLATIEGRQPLLVEVQALVNKTNFGYPKRTASGFDVNRLNLLIAVLERRTKLELGDKDIYVNVVGGLKLSDSAADLAVAMAIASNATNLKLDKSTVVFGEIGLGGEIRSVPLVNLRIKEAQKLGFTRAIAPKSDFNLDGKAGFTIETATNLKQILIKYLTK